MRHRVRLLVLAIASTFALLAAGGGTAAAAGCGRVASPTGSDSAAGTEASPYRTAKKLSDSLSAGQTGCLRAGTYAENLKVTHGGASGSPVTITSYPGERATVKGRMWIAQGANFVTLSDLNIDGRNANSLPSPTINAADTIFKGDDVTNYNTEICFLLGNSGWGRAVRTVLDGNRIHNCGQLPSTNLDHGIYLARSDYARIVNNLIYDNADRGIQLYPDAQHTYIAHNVIDGNGTGLRISGAEGVASSDTVAEDNMITNSRLYNVDSWYPSGNPTGKNNVVRQNCISGAAKANTGTQRGFTASNNLFKDPLYLNRAAHDYRLLSISPCLKFA